jgi:aminoglycoside phosphotransferase (APT) family kinase protein
VPSRTLTGYLAVLAADGQPAGPDGAELRSGQFHDVVLAGSVAYRFPRDAESRRLLPERAALLSELAARARSEVLVTRPEVPVTRAELPVELPEPRGTDWMRWVRRPLGTCYLPVRRLSGTPPTAGLADDPLAADALVTQLAGLLSALASAGADDRVRQVVPAATPGAWQAWAAQVRSVLFPLMSAAGRQRAEAELAAVEAVPSTGAALVHGDLGGANLLFEESGGVPRLTGVLDWDDACIGSQANDLASLAATFGWPLTTRVDRRLRDRADSMLPAARRIVATFALQQALPAALSGDQVSLDDGLDGYVRDSRWLPAGGSATQDG